MRMLPVTSVVAMALVVSCVAPEPKMLTPGSLVVRMDDKALSPSDSKLTQQGATEALAQVLLKSKKDISNYSMLGVYYAPMDQCWYSIYYRKSNRISTPIIAFVSDDLTRSYIATSEHVLRASGCTEIRATEYYSKVRRSELHELPYLLYSFDPILIKEYPVIAAAGGIQGEVVVQFIVDENGKMTRALALSGPAPLKAFAEKISFKSIPPIKGVTIDKPCLLTISCMFVAHRGEIVISRIIKK